MAFLRQVIFQPLLSIDDDLEKLKFILQIPFNIQKNEFAFWKLLYGLKWQADEYDEEVSSQVKIYLIEVFNNLNYSKPELEAELVMMLFDGMATAILLKDIKNQQEIQHLIFKKYNKTKVET